MRFPLFFLCRYPRDDRAVGGKCDPGSAEHGGAVRTDGEEGKRGHTAGEVGITLQALRAAAGPLLYEFFTF